MVPEIDVRSLVARKQYEGELRFEFDAEQELLDIPFVRFSSPVTATLRYGIFEDDSVEVRGRIAFSLEGLCSRCLSEAREDVTGEVDAVFSAGALRGEEYGYRNGKVSLGECLRDAVLFALPPKLLCGDCGKEE